MPTSLRPIQRTKTPVYTVAVSPDASRYLFAGGTPGGDCSISVYDAATNELLHTLVGHRKPVVRARFLDDNSIVSFGFDSHVCHWTAAGNLAVSNETHLAHRADGFAVFNGGGLAVVGDYRGEISVQLQFLRRAQRAFKPASFPVPAAPA